MVARSDGPEDCEHENVCDACAFRRALTNHIEAASGKGERVWTLGVGGLAESLLLGAALLHNVRRERYDVDPRHGTAERVAAVLVDLWKELELLREQLKHD